VFEGFVSAFRLLPGDQASGSPWRDPRLLAVAGYSELVGPFAGCTFENGLYRLHDEVSGPRAEALVAEAFPAFHPRACPFGYDWLGRQFLVDAGRIEDGEPQVLLAEPGTGEVLEVPLSFAAFHEQLFELREPALAAEFFSAWTRSNPNLVPIEPADCVGYQVPLFLGGKDSIENLEVIDLDVYWSICSQLHKGTRHLPPGTSIREVALGD
jgi:type VI secretion system (T6SS) immunity protein Tdi1